MLKHIVMWKMKDDLKGSQKFDIALEIKAALEGLKEKIPEIINIEVGLDGSLGVQECKCQGDAHHNWDICLVSSFESAKALKKYANHPEHLKVTDLVKANVKSRSCVDYM